ncbi:MAG: N-acetyltransferase family protein [Chloroflexi bacterium]|nr:N-acetyltransferase family protein [Chloroflexota bacterium]
MNADIRLATTADAAAIHQIYAPIVRETHISFELSVPDVAEIAARIRQTRAQYPWLVCEIDGRLAGYAYASVFRARRAYQWTTETTVYVHPDFQRRGVSRALYRSLIAVLRAQGYCNAVGVIALPNEASIRAHEAAGFRKIGVFENVGFKAGNWRHTGWWQLELRPMPEAPPPPQPIAELAREARFAALLQSGLHLLANR